MKKNKTIFNFLKRAGLAVMAWAFTAQVFAENQERAHVPITIDDIIRAQALPEKNRQDLNERLHAMAGAARFSQDYLLGPGDVIQVTVFGVENLNKLDLTIDSEGRITLPFINTVGLIGLTPREAEVKIAALYEASVIKNPQVSVNVKEFNSQFINVLGAVKNPGPIRLTRRVFLLDALALAGGLVTEKAEPIVIIQRSGTPTAAEAAAGVNAYRLNIDLDQLLIKGDSTLNVPLYAGDIVSVPEKINRYYYVLGDVNSSGAFEIKRGESITLTKALAAAGGFMGTAKKSKSVIIRKKEDGSTEQIPVDAGQIIKGKKADLALSDSDVLFIPGSTTKMISRTVLGSIGSLVNTFVYYGIR